MVLNYKITRTVPNYIYFFQGVARNDSTGMLLEYDPSANKGKVLVRALGLPCRLGISIDGSFILICNITGKTVQKNWLKGPKANTVEISINFPGRAVNIARTASGQFWMAGNIEVPQSQTTVPAAFKINASGTKILANVPLGDYYNLSTVISEVHEHSDAVYISSVFVDFIVLLKI